MSKNKKLAFCLLTCLSVAVLFLGSINIAGAETCSGECESGSTCPQGKSPTGEECAAGNICCKASSSGSGSTTTEFPPPLKWKTVDQVITAVIKNLQGVLITLAILFIVIGGIMYITSGGNEERIKKAKAVITYACIGLAIALAGPSFLKQIREILEVKEPSAVDDEISLSEIITNILKFLLSILGIVAIIALVISGGMYLTSAGMEERMKSAKRMFTYAVIGIVVSLSSLIIVQQIAKLLERD